MHDYDVTHKIAEYVKEHLQTDALAARWPFYVFLSGAMVRASRSQQLTTHRVGRWITRALRG